MTALTYETLTGLIGTGFGDFVIAPDGIHTSLTPGKCVLPLPCSLEEFQKLPGAKEAFEYSLASREAFLDGDLWRRMDPLTPLEAAMLLSGRNPNEPAPHDDNFRVLLRFFEKETGWHRSLADWQALAKSRNMRILQWDFSVIAPDGRQTGVPSKELIEHFRLGEEWKDQFVHLRDCPFLESALQQRGKAPRPHLWNPAKFAILLVQREKKNTMVLKAIINKHFSTFADEFQDWLDSQPDKYPA